MPPPSRAGLFLGLLALAAWIEAPRGPATTGAAARIPERQPPPEGQGQPQSAQEQEQEQENNRQQEQGRQQRKSWVRPLEGNYAASLTSAIVALSPFIVVTTAYALFTRQVAQDVHASRTALSILGGLLVAGYAFGALLGGDLVQRFRQRRMFLAAELLFALGCLLAAVAHAPPVYAAGRVLSGFSTGLLLVVALPPVIQKFPASKLPFTVVAVNIGFFGAVCIGPLLGLGAGATVSPGLYMAGFPLASQIIGRVFALVELLRSLADYIIAPVMMQIAHAASGQNLDPHGIHLSVRITLWLTVAFTVFGSALYVLGRGGLPKPDLERWLSDR